MTCNPPPTDTDDDQLVLVSDLQEYITDKEADGFVCCTSYPGEDFTSLRRGEVNLIVTQKQEFFDKFVFATKIAKKLNLQKKEDRVALFQAILYNKIEEEI